MVPLVITTGSRAGRAWVLNPPCFPKASDLRVSTAGYPKNFQAKEQTWASVTDTPLYSWGARLRGHHPQVWHDGAAFGPTRHSLEAICRGTSVGIQAFLGEFWALFQELMLPGWNENDPICW